MKNKKEVAVNNLRDDLKAIMEKELEKIPEYLKDLEPREKLNFIVKLMPFVLPKVESVHYEKGEGIFF